MVPANSSFLSSTMKCDPDMADKVYRFISFRHPHLCLGKDPTVIRWLFRDLSFLEDRQSPVRSRAETKMQRKELEKQWGMNILQRCRPDLNPRMQWTNSLGEYIATEILMLLNESHCQVNKIGRLRPDLETENAIWEVPNC